MATGRGCFGSSGGCDVALRRTRLLHRWPWPVSPMSRPRCQPRPRERGCGGSNRRLERMRTPVEGLGPRWPTSGPRRSAQTISAKPARQRPRLGARPTRSGEAIRVGGVRGDGALNAIPDCRWMPDPGTGFDKIGFMVWSWLRRGRCHAPFNYPALPAPASRRGGGRERGRAKPACMKSSTASAPAAPVPWTPAFPMVSRRC